MLVQRKVLTFSICCMIVVSELDLLLFFFTDENADIERLRLLWCHVSVVC